MNKGLKSFLQYFIFLGGGLALVWWQLSSMNEEERKDFNYALKHVRYWYILPVIAMSLLSHLARALRWRLLMEPLGYRPTITNTFCTTMVGYLANTAVPRLGEIYKCTLLAKHENLRSDKLIGTIVLERAFDFTCYLIFIGITILIQLKVVGSFAKEELEKAITSTGMPMWAKAVITITSIIVVIFLFKWLSQKYRHHKFVLKIRLFFAGIKDGLNAIRHLKKRKLFLFYTLVIWALYLLQIYVGFSAMAATEHLTLKAACAVLTLATLAMIATPGGIGTFPIGVQKTLEVYKVEGTLGNAFGWIMWGVSTAIIIITGIICFLLLPVINRNKPKTISDISIN